MKDFVTYEVARKLKEKGFRENVKIRAYESHYGWVVHIDDETCVTVFSKRINHLHQLQNAYYMAIGEELEIQP